jgi:hypothetical protein
MRAPSPTIGMAAAPRRAGQTRLGYGFLQQIAQYLGLFLLVLSPFSRDPIAFAVGGVTPWVLVKLIGRPGMPAAVSYYVLWQWLQVYARELQTLADGEALARGIFGPTIERAYWYMLASIVIMAACYRLVLGNLPSRTSQRGLHETWRTQDLLVLYIGSAVLSTLCRIAGGSAGAVAQPLEVLGDIKILGIMVLFISVMTTGRGYKMMLAAVGFEVISGFTGILGDFRGVFIFLAIAAIAARIRWTGTMAVATVVWMSVLLTLGLFWTAVKVQYREVATQSTDSQNIKTPVSERLGYLGGRAASVDEINWEDASYMLLIRLAYVDIFGSVISVKEVSPEPGYMRQWNDALEHVLKPRFLFPSKAPLSDTEVFMRLARGDASEDMRGGTSISVGYMAENFVDLGFPGMLIGIAVLGLIGAAVLRYFVTLKVPWVIRESFGMTFIYAICHDGVEISLPKLLGATLMFFLVFAPLVRFGLPSIFRWLSKRSELAQPV